MGADIGGKVTELAGKLNHSGCTRQGILDSLDEDEFMEYEAALDAKFKPVSEVVIVKEPVNTGKGSESEKNRSIVAPRMLGLNSPEQDLH